jgi:hypothetical protein
LTSYGELRWYFAPRILRSFYVRWNLQSRLSQRMHVGRVQLLIFVLVLNPLMNLHQMILQHIRNGLSAERYAALVRHLKRGNHGHRFARLPCRNDDHHRCEEEQILRRQSSPHLHRALQQASLFFGRNLLRGRGGAGPLIRLYGKRFFRRLRFRIPARRCSCSHIDFLAV